MTRFAFAILAIAFAAVPAVAQQGGKDVPFAKLMGDGAQVKAVDSKDRLIIQFGKYVFTCRQDEGKPYLCDQLI